MALTDLIRYSIGRPESYEKGKPYFVMYSDGVYLQRDVGVALVSEKYEEFNMRSIPGLKKGTEGIVYKLPKVPFKYWLMILDFYKKVNDEDKTEASVHIFYHEGELDIPEEYEDYKVGLLREGNWIVYCPQQVNSSTLTSFGEDALYEWFRRNTVKVIETHSHNTMDAFWSGTDDRNQQDAMYYGVYGLLDTEDKFLMKFVKDGETIDVPVNEVFEFPMVKVRGTVEGVDGYEGVCLEEEEDKYKIYKGLFGRRNEFPEEWYTECHTVKSYRKKKGIHKNDEDFLCSK